MQWLACRRRKPSAQQTTGKTPLKFFKQILARQVCVCYIVQFTCEWLRGRCHMQKIHYTLSTSRAGSKYSCVMCSKSCHRHVFRRRAPCTFLAALKDIPGSNPRKHSPRTTVYGGCGKTQASQATQNQSQTWRYPRNGRSLHNVQLQTRLLHVFYGCVAPPRHAANSPEDMWSTERFGGDGPEPAIRTRHVPVLPGCDMASHSMTAKRREEENAAYMLRQRAKGYVCHVLCAAFLLFILYVSSRGNANIPCSNNLYTWLLTTEFACSSA